jgi:hypothetical protein
MQLSSRSQVRDLKIHHEALQEELTYTKNHLHHVEVGAGNRTAACWSCSSSTALQHSSLCIPLQLTVFSFVR